MWNDLKAAECVDGERVIECTETVIAGRCCHAASGLWQWIDLIGHALLDRRGVWSDHFRKRQMPPSGVTAAFGRWRRNQR
jgi:hypothetical protein